MRDIIGYEGLYAVTSCGKVWSYKSKKFLKLVKKKNGYFKVNLYKDRKSKSFLVHRLVAEAYIPNPGSLETVDHIDGNKEHNYINNLQWMTQKDNSCKTNGIKVKCLETGKVFKSSRIAAKEMSLDNSGISKVCRGEQKTTKGYHFEYIKE
jgi:hypothetical protein